MKKIKKNKVILACALALGVGAYASSNVDAVTNATNAPADWAFEAESVPLHDAILAKYPTIDTNADTYISKSEAGAYTGPIVLSEQKITGKINGLENFTRIQRLNLADNLFYGEIPKELFSSSTITSILLQKNLFVGNLAEISRLLNIETLDVSNNFLSGNFPNIDSNIKLKHIDASKNSFTGLLPVIKYNLLLENYAFALNMFSGEIPSFDNNVNIKSILLYSNFLSGSIPSLENSQNLVGIDVNHNELSGTLPLISNLNTNNLNLVFADNDLLIGNIPTSYNDLSIKLLEISNTNIKGESPMNTVNFVNGNPKVSISNEILYSDNTTKFGTLNGGFMVYNQKTKNNQNYINKLARWSIPQFNIDVNGDGKADLNIDANGDDIPDFNQATPVYETDALGKNTSLFIGWIPRGYKLTNHPVVSSDVIINNNSFFLENANSNSPKVIELTHNISLPDGTNIVVRQGGSDSLGSSLDLNSPNANGGFSNIDIDDDGIPDFNIISASNDKAMVSGVDSNGLPEFSNDVILEIPDTQSTDPFGPNYLKPNQSIDNIKVINVDRGDGMLLNVDIDGDGVADVNLDANATLITDVQIADLRAASAATVVLLNSDKTGLNSDVAKAEIDAAIALLDKVKDLEYAKTTIKPMVDLAEKMFNAKDATSSLLNADKSNVLPETTQTKIDDAKKLVDLLPTGSLKTSLLSDIAKAQTLLDAQNAASDAVAALFLDDKKEAIKAGMTQKQITDAKAKVDALVDGDIKTQLLNDLKNIQDIFDNDINNDGVKDLNIDTNGDGKADLNITEPGSKDPILNIVTDGNGNVKLPVSKNDVPDVNIDTNNDGLANLNIDTDGDLKPDVNVVTDGNGNLKKPVLDTDLADVNIDNTGDLIPDLNIDVNNDLKPDVNIDTDSNGVADKNVIQNTDPTQPNYVYPDTKQPIYNVDTDNNGIVDFNIIESDFKMVDNFKEEDGILVIYRTGKTEETTQLSNEYTVDIQVGGKALTTDQLKNVTYSVKAIGGFDNAKTYVEVVNGTNKIIAKKSGVVEITGTYNGLSSTITVVIPGDVSRDGKIALADVKLISRYLAEKGDINQLKPVDKYSLLLADLTGDEKIGLADTKTLKRMITGAIAPSN